VSAGPPTFEPLTGHPPDTRRPWIKRDQGDKLERPCTGKSACKRQCAIAR
jgi:hypothetical protein